MGTLHSMFNKGDKINSYYTDEGKKTGLAYEAHISIFKEEDKYDTEFLVSKDYLIQELKNKCNLQLIETQLFGNIYEDQRYFFKTIISNEESKDNSRKYL